MYALIHNNKICVGPREWSKPFFQKYLKTQGINYDVPFTAPSPSYLITDDFKILKVINITMPEYDPLFEELTGPTFTIYERSIYGEYSYQERSIEAIKNTMKEIVTANRYDLEIQGCNYTFPDNQEVHIYTNRYDRSTYLDAMLVMPENSTVNFKFKGPIWRNLSKTDLAGIIAVGSAWIQNVFNWEEDTHILIDAASDIDTLKEIQLKHPLLETN